MPADNRQLARSQTADAKSGATTARRTTRRLSRRRLVQAGVATATGVAAAAYLSPDIRTIRVPVASAFTF
jgi:hypothetical protein